MLKLAVSKTLAENILCGKQNLIVTDHDYNEAGDLITLISKEDQKPLVYASVDSCTCDSAKHLFRKLHLRINNFTESDFNQATGHHKLAFLLKLSQPQKA